MKFRNLIGSLGLVGALGFSPKVSAEDTGYLDMSREEILGVLTQRAVVLNDSNFKHEVLDYDGDAIVLYNSSCNRTELADSVDRNMEIVYLQLIEKFKDTHVRELPLKFGVFDGCRFVGNNASTIIGLEVTTLETHMYVDGREIDRMRGGPKNEIGLTNKLNDMILWIEYTLLGIRQLEDQDKDVVALYKGDGILEAYPRSEIQR